LAETPLCHVALYLYRRNSSGTLVIDAGKRTETRIRFARGRPVAARIPFAREGLLACILPLCGLRVGVFEFFETDLVGEHDDVVQGVVDPYELISASLDDHARDDVVDALLTRFADTKLRIQAGRDLARLRLPSRDGALLELIRAAPASPRELIAQAPLPELRVRRVIYALIATHMVSPHQEHEPEDPNYRSQVELGAESASLPINDVAASGARAWQQLASLRPGGPATSQRPVGPANSLRPGGLATTLRPGAPTPPASARPRAGSGPISSLRPGALPGQSNPSPPPSSHRPLAQSGAPNPDDHPANVRRVEQLLMRGRSDEALEMIDKMLAARKDQSDLLGLRAQALFEKHRAGDDGTARVVVDAIKRALEVDPDDTRALFARGLVLQRAGEAKKALAYFRRVAQLDPKHLEAQREIRLAKLRSE
jgi:tetratricopeptide (TPR) repeat protein